MAFHQIAIVSLIAFVPMSLMGGWAWASLSVRGYSRRVSPIRPYGSTGDSFRRFLEGRYGGPDKSLGTREGRLPPPANGRIGAHATGASGIARLWARIARRGTVSNFPNNISDSRKGVVGVVGEVGDPLLSSASIFYFLPLITDLIFKKKRIENKR
jgi:hypothetical protein